MKNILRFVLLIVACLVALHWSSRLDDTGAAAPAARRGIRDSRMALSSLSSEFHMEVLLSEENQNAESSSYSVLRQSHRRASSSSSTLTSSSSASSPRKNLAWLVSYPYSGALSVLHWMNDMGVTTAFNEVDDVRDFSPSSNRYQLVSALPDSDGHLITHGPWLLQSSADITTSTDSQQSATSKVILTSTHCLSDHHYHVKGETGDDEFLDACLQTSGIERNENELHYNQQQHHDYPQSTHHNTESLQSTTTTTRKTVNFVPVRYNLVHVKQAVLLIRDPVDNILAHFLKHHPSGTAGELRSWCSAKASAEKEHVKETAANVPNFQQNDGLVDVVRDLENDFPGVPCVDQLHKYVNWHNQALRSVDNIPILPIRWENLSVAEDRQVLLNFLQVPLSHDLVDPSLGKPAADAHEYFSAVELQAIREFVEQHAIHELREILL